jgi:hypothetical protein
MAATVFWNGESRASWPAEAIPVRPWAPEHAGTVRLAQQSDTKASLVILERLQRAHPENFEVTRDLIAILTWDGRDAEAIQRFALTPPPHPDYVIQAVGLAYVIWDRRPWPWSSIAKGSAGWKGVG